jgi:tripartite-type tricarboxylate transporter receptor subunit TctC
VAAAKPMQWPTRRVRWIVPAGPGGASDVIARTLAQKLGERSGQAITIDNRPGGNTVIAALEGAHAVPDGYTLFQPINATLTVNQFTLSKLPYDPMRDFTPVAMLATVPLLVLASSSFQGRTLEDLIAEARKAPDTITFGAGTTAQLQLEEWMRDWNVKFRYVPYKSAPDITTALLSGEVQVAVDGIPNNLAHIQAGKMRALAVNTAKRVPSLPDVRTMAELGVKHTEPPIWHGLVAPAGLSPELARTISGEIQALLAMDDVREKLLGLGLEPVSIGPQEFANHIRSEAAKVGPLVKELGIRWN